MRKNGTDGKNGFYILTVVLLTSPFYLNDFANMYVKNWRWWLFVDYAGVKLFPLLFALWLICSKKMRALEFGLKAQSTMSSIVVFLLVALVGTVIDQNGYQLIAKLSGLPAAWRHAGDYESCLELGRPHVWTINGGDMRRTHFPRFHAHIHQQVHRKFVCHNRDFFSCIRSHPLEPRPARRTDHVDYRRSFHDCIPENAVSAGHHVRAFCNQLHRLCRCHSQVNIQRVTS